MDQTIIPKLLTKYLNQEQLSNIASIEILEKFLSNVHFKKGSQPIKAEKIHNFAYIIIKGAARSFYLKNGIEVNTWFAFENEFVGSLQNYQGKVAHETVEFLEDSECVRIDLFNLNKEKKKNIIISNFVCAVIEEYADFLEEKLQLLLHNEGIDRYLHILENEPNLLKRIPLTYLASYLGMSRETLSRLRAKITL